MKNLLLAIALIFSHSYIYSQNDLQLLLDGIPSGSVYTDSIGVLSLSGNTDFYIMSYTIYTNDSNKAMLNVQPYSKPLGPLMRWLPSGTKVTILARVGCPSCAIMQLNSVYTIP